MRKIPFQFSHGSYIREKLVERTVEGTGATAIDVETDFNYLFPDLAKDPNSLLPADNPADTIAKLKDLGNAMIDAQEPIDPAEANSDIPPVYTYWGQFIDHDVTANTDRASQDLQTDIIKDDFQPLAPDFVAEKLKNLRRPVFDLDSVYGDGPTLNPTNPTEAKDFYQEDDPVKFKIGQNALKNSAGDDVPGERIPPTDDLMRDLPRKDRNAIIGDSRNDENLIVAQLHTAFLRFHNAVVDWIRTNEPKSFKDEQGLFERAQNLVRWHHQWLVVNDFLKTLTVDGTVDNILKGGLKFYDLQYRDIFMPLEFSVAAYRFGHSMVRAGYDYNRNFGLEAVLIPSASFELLFSFTGRGNIGERNGPGANDTLPFNWIIEWDRFVDKTAAAERQRRSARKIDTHLTPPLSTMINEGEDEPSTMIKELLKHLAKRNLLRGYLLSIPTGQSLAAKLGVPKLTPEELKQDNSDAMNQALEPFLEKTPAWFYILKEAEVRAKGDTLGEVGSRLAAETFIGLMMNDPASYLNQRDYNNQQWEPGKGVRLPDGGEIHTIGDFLKFAGVML
ncbi:hypothetical protein H6F88_30870 [Oculatella sp. FACHB-28]|uniref:peroxidase family protein n=1 Tax=Oculatella sp. FACHB-28 TaxID=2692845 RepID=UPI0016867AEA|nr:heme peroxidase family protein [Oculatella sp. FACHB-28]MBD2060347.1 hypothetical protein [Oculatella sp. FACHB-28]